MKLFCVAILVIAVLGSGMAQRPTYAGSRPIGLPDLASRFKDPAEEATETVLNSRVGEGSTTGTVPVDARGDYELVNRLNEWPREHRPFWLLNAEAIEAARRPAPGQNVQNSQQNLQNRNTFQGDFQDFPETVTIKATNQRSTFLSSTSN